MSDSVFNSYIKSVYGSGSSMHVFDQHISGGEFDIIGGVDDISVSSIFGGMDSDSDREDSNCKKNESSKSYDSDSDDSDSDDSDDKQNSKKVKPGHTFQSGGDTNDNEELYDDLENILKNGAGCVKDGETKNVEDYGEDSVESLISSISIPINGNAITDHPEKSNESKMSVVMPMSLDIKKAGGLSAHDVASMITAYK